MNITQSIFAFRDDDSIETKVQRINYPRMATIAQTEETHEYFDKFIQMGNNIFDAFEKANPFNLMEFLMKNVINAIRDLSTPRNVAMSNFTKWTIAHSLGMVNYFFFSKNPWIVIICTYMYSYISHSLLATMPLNNSKYYICFGCNQ